MSGSAAIPMVSVNDGTRHFEFNDEGAFRAYLAATTSSSTSASLSAYIDEFKAFPMVDDVLITYLMRVLKQPKMGQD